MTDYKATLNLPETAFPMKAGLPQREPELLQRWNGMGLYQKLRQIGVDRLVEVRSADRALLHDAVGSLADWLVQLAHGEDPRPVEPDRPSKSASSENTYAQDLTDIETIRAEIERMARENADWLSRRGIEARSVSIKVRYAGFATVTRSHTLSLPTSDADVLASWAAALLEKTEAGTRPVRLLGAKVFNLMEP